MLPPRIINICQITDFLFLSLLISDEGEADAFIADININIPWKDKLISALSLLVLVHLNKTPLIFFDKSEFFIFFVFFAENKTDNC